MRLQATVMAFQRTSRRPRGSSEAVRLHVQIGAEANVSGARDVRHGATRGGGRPCERYLAYSIKGASRPYAR